MFGKHFSSMYSGSLFGKPAIVFAVWGYAISNMRPSRKDGECYVEINPTLLAATFATGVESVNEALATLESPDPASRTKRDDGRRLILLGDERHAGPMQYRVVNGASYRATRDEQDRRDYLREAKRAERSRKRVNNVNNVNPGQPPSTQAEAEAEAEAEAKKESLLSEASGRRTRKKVSLLLTAELRTVGLAYNSLASEWDKRNITDQRLHKLATAIETCRAAVKAEDPAFTFTELFARIREQAQFFRGTWVKWDLEWLVSTKRGDFNASKVWAREYRGRTSPRPVGQAPRHPAPAMISDEVQAVVNRATRDGAS